MGKMCNQDPRPTREIGFDGVEAFIAKMKEIAEKQQVSLEETLKAYEVIAYERRTKIIIDSGDYTDENMCGIGTAIKEVGEQIRDIADALQEIATKDM